MADNSIKYWDSGFPYTGIESGNSAGSMKYWDSGFPYNTMFTPTSVIKTVNSMAIAGIKTFKGIPIAQIKKVNGLLNS